MQSRLPGSTGVDQHEGKVRAVSPVKPSNQPTRYWINGCQWSLVSRLRGLDLLFELRSQTKADDKECHAEIPRPRLHLVSSSRVISEVHTSDTR